MLPSLSMTDENDRLVDAITGILPPLLNALDGLEFAARNLHPEGLERLWSMLSPLAERAPQCPPGAGESRLAGTARRPEKGAFRQR